MADFKKQKSPYLGFDRKKLIETKYFLMSDNADRRIMRVGDFPRGIWKEVPFGVWQSMKDAEGWKGKVESAEIEGGKR